MSSNVGDALTTLPIRNQLMLFIAFKPERPEVIGLRVNRHLGLLLSNFWRYPQFRIAQTTQGHRIAKNSKDILCWIIWTLSNNTSNYSNLFFLNSPQCATVEKSKEVKSLLSEVPKAEDCTDARRRDSGKRVLGEGTEWDCCWTLPIW